MAEELISQTYLRQGIQRGQLTIHADRGSALTSKPVALLLADLGVTKTHSRPHVSNDNPYSEAQFKTMRYLPDYLSRFGSRRTRALGQRHSWTGTTTSITTLGWRCRHLRMCISTRHRVCFRNGKRFWMPRIQDAGTV